MLRRGPLFLLLLQLAACSLPAPYQTYAPDAPPPAAPPPLASFDGPTTASSDVMTNFGLADTPPSPFLPTPSAASSSGERVAICYNRIWNSSAAVRSAALQACGNAGDPRIVDQGIDLDACPLMTPIHAVFACAASQQSSR